MKIKPRGPRQLARRIKELQSLSGAPGWSESLIYEIRAIRDDNEEKYVERSEDRTQSATIHGTECSICGQLGDHTCLPILHEMIENHEEYASYCWQVLKEMEAKELL